MTNVRTYGQLRHIARNQKTQDTEDKSATTSTFRKRTEKELPPAIDQIKISHGGTILGNEIYMTGDLNKAVEARIKKANNEWKHVSRKIFRKKASSGKIRYYYGTH